MEFHIFTADCTQVASNVLYPHEHAIRSPADIVEAVKYDNVCGDFKDHHRSIDNFIYGDCIMLDCDNTDTDKEEDWFFPERVAELLEDISFVAVPSRNHMKPKKGKSPRPKHHYFFPITPSTDPEAVTNLKRTIQSHLPFFDIRALDAAHFAYGAKCALGDVYWHKGIFTIDQIDLPEYLGEDPDPGIPGEDEVGRRPIQQGSRNSEMHSFACTILKKYGDTPRARQIFDERATDCEPPLPKREIEQVWGSALKFFHKTIATDPSYRPHEGPAEIPSFILVTKRGETVSPPLLARYFRENVYYLLVRDSGTQGMLFYVYDHGVYKIYAPEMVKGVLKGFVSAYDKTLVKMGQINEAYQNIITDLQLTLQTDLNADEDIVNFQNGLLHLSTMTLSPHDPAILSTIQIPCNWEPATPTPVFDSYLHTLTDGNKDIENLLLEFTGACLSSIKGHRMKKALFLVGKGNTGKSQLRSLVERLLGQENYASADLRSIEARFGTGAIYGTRLAGTADMSFLSIEELKTFKKITGGDSVLAEFKGQQAFKYTYSGLLWFCMNQLPKFGGDDGQWVYDRILVVSCPNVIPEEKQDKLLLDKMYREREGIVYKAICALKNVIAAGYKFTEPAIVSEARENYRNENSSIIRFFQECMEPAKSTRVPTTTKVFNVYKAWCDDNNNRYYKMAKEFREGLAEYLGVDVKALIKHTNHGSIFDGYTLNSEARNAYPGVFAYSDDDDD